MLSKKQIGKIQDMTWCGYTKTDIIRYYQARGWCAERRGVGGLDRQYLFAKNKKILILANRWIMITEKFKEV